MMSYVEPEPAYFLLLVYLIYYINTVNSISINWLHVYLLIQNNIFKGMFLDSRLFLTLTKIFCLFAVFPLHLNHKFLSQCCKILNIFFSKEPRPFSTISTRASSINIIVVYYISVIMFNSGIKFKKFKTEFLLYIFR